jgi:hypothetical protein
MRCFWWAVASGGSIFAKKKQGALEAKDSAGFVRPFGSDHVILAMQGQGGAMGVEGGAGQHQT